MGVKSLSTATTIPRQNLISESTKLYWLAFTQFFFLGGWMLCGGRHLWHFPLFVSRVQFLPDDENLTSKCEIACFLSTRWYIIIESKLNMEKYENQLQREKQILNSSVSTIYKSFINDKNFIFHLCRTYQKNSAFFLIHGSLCLNNRVIHSWHSFGVMGKLWQIIFLIQSIKVNPYERINTDWQLHT